MKHLKLKLLSNYFLFTIYYWLWLKPQTIVWSLGCQYWPFKKYKIGETIALTHGNGNTQKYMILGYGNDNGPVYITKPLNIDYPKEYRPYCYYVDRAKCFKLAEVSK